MPKLLLMAQKLTLEWAQLENSARALIFDAETWAVFDKVEQSQSKTAQQIISTVIAGTLGTTVMDNYAINRGSD